MAVFRGDADRVRCVELASGVSSLPGVQDFIAAHETRDTVVAIDAPLIIENLKGQRPCERLVSSRFAAAHAGAHTSNLSLYHDAGGVRLTNSLVARGYRHCSAPTEAWEPRGRWLFEVYPHPAHVVLFGRSRIIKYKKGRVSDRRRGLAEFSREIKSRIFGAVSPFEPDLHVVALLSTDVERLRGRALKQHEDLLDALLCCYLAFHLWRWGWSRNDLIGDLQSGYIVVPTVSLPTTVERHA